MIKIDFDFWFLYSLLMTILGIVIIVITLEGGFT